MELELRLSQWPGELHCPFPHHKIKERKKKKQSNGKVQYSACPEALYNIPVVSNAKTNYHINDTWLQK